VILVNQILETIRNRRSIRKYLSEQLPRELLDEILDAALWAPSGHNEQPWHFLVVQDAATLDRINDETKKRMGRSDIGWVRDMGNNENFHVFYHAPTVVIVSGREVPGGILSPKVDCSAAIENMILAATSLGVGSCWIGLTAFFFADRNAIGFLGIPEGYVPYYSVTLGRTDPTFTLRAPKRKENCVSWYVPSESGR
jgi:nitroreductase